MSDWISFFQDVVDYGPQILQGLGNTLLIWVVITLTGLLGSILVFYLTLSQHRLVRRLTDAYISFFIGTPLTMPAICAPPTTGSIRRSWKRAGPRGSHRGRCLC